MRAKDRAAEHRRLVCSVEEAAKKLDVAPNTYYAGIKAGTLPAIRVGRLFKVPLALLDRLLEGAQS